MRWTLTLAAAGAIVACGAGAAMAQTAAPPAAAVTQFASSADIQALVAKARAVRTAAQPNLTGQKIVGLAPYVANLEVRSAAAGAAVHEKEDELFYVVAGSATVITGGQLTHMTRTNPANLTGEGIEGGTSRSVGKGDMLLVPQNTPHQFIAIKGELIMVSLHLPRG